MLEEKITKKIILMFLLIMVCFQLIAGGTKESTKVKAAEPAEVIFFRPGMIIEPDKDPVLLELQRRLNIKLKYHTAPYSEVEQRLAVLINGGERLDVCTHVSLRHPMRKWAEEGLFNSIDDFIKKDTHPFLYTITNSETFSPLKINGKAYYVPNINHGAKWAFAIRTDWLKNVNLPMPRTFEDFYRVAKAFKENDPDKNGLNDTIAYQMEGGNAICRSMLPLLMPYGISNWRIAEKPITIGKDGKLVHEFTTNGLREGLKFINKLYREGLVNSDFPNMKDLPSTTAKYFSAGKAGIAWVPTDFVANLFMNNPKATADQIPPLQSPPGYEFVGFRGLSYDLFIGFPKSGKNPAKAMELFEYVNSREGRELMICGIKGVHYTKLSPDGTYDRNRAEWEKTYDIKAFAYDHPLWINFMTSIHGYIPIEKYSKFEDAVKNLEIWVDKKDLEENPWNIKSALEKAAKYGGWENPFMVIEFPELADISVKLEQVKNVYWTKMVLAENDDDFNRFWNEYLAEWKKVGGEEYLKAYQNYYDKNLKKK